MVDQAEMSRFALSCEHTAVAAYSDDVILPPNPASRRCSKMNRSGCAGVPNS